MTGFRAKGTNSFLTIEILEPSVKVKMTERPTPTSRFSLPPVDQAGLAALVLLLLTVSAGAGRSEEKPAAAAADWLWFYAPCNFQVNEQVDLLLAHMKRARKAGYNGVVITDSKFGRLAGRPQNYYDNLRRTARAGKELGIEIIPMVGAFGYSNDLLQNDPNLAEGLAVRDCLFTVAQDRAAVADASNLLPAGDFERFQGDRPTGWDYVDGPGKSVFADSAVHHGGKRSLRLEQFRAGSEAGNARVIEKVKVKPWQQYHVSAWVRTRDVAPAGEVHITVLGGNGRSLDHTSLGVKPTQEWSQHHIVFNSQDNDTLTVLAGIWGGSKGALWLDDLEMRQVAGVNLLRRQGCPLRVTSADGKTEYTEGKDFRRWVDPRMGQVPWPGGYEVYHAGPALELKPGSRIRSGEKLAVSFYHTQTIHEGVVCCCLTHDDVFRYFEESAQFLYRTFQPKKLFLTHDEIRLADQCELCRQRKQTAGRILADHVQRCGKILQRVAPQAEVLDWSDMFDPHHNAVDNYYLVGSTLEKSWEGLAPEMIVVNWNSGKASKSLRFFAGRRHRQIIAGYYDTDNVEAEVKAWSEAARGVPKVQGFLYTTWRNDYRDLEKYAAAVRRR